MLAQRFHRMANPIRYMHTPEGLDGLRNYMKFASRILGMPQLITSARSLGGTSGLMDHQQDMPHIGHALDSFMHEGHPADLMALLDMLHEDRGIQQPAYTTTGMNGAWEHQGQTGPLNSLLQVLHHLHQSGQRAETNPHHISRFMQTGQLDSPQGLDSMGRLFSEYHSQGRREIAPSQLPTVYDSGEYGQSVPLYAMNNIFDQATQQARQARTGGQQ